MWYMVEEVHLLRPFIEYILRKIGAYTLPPLMGC